MAARFGVLGLAVVALGTANVDAGMYIPSPDGDISINGEATLPKSNPLQSESGRSNGLSPLYLSVDNGNTAISTVLVLPTATEDRLQISMSAVANGMTDATSEQIIDSAAFATNNLYLNYRVDVAGVYKITWDMGIAVNGSYVGRNNIMQFSVGGVGVVADVNNVQGPNGPTDFTKMMGSAVFNATPGQNNQINIYQTLFEMPLWFAGGGYSTAYANVTIAPYDPTAVPEPTAALLPVAIAAMGFLRRRRAM